MKISSSVLEVKGRKVLMKRKLLIMLNVVVVIFSEIRIENWLGNLLLRRLLVILIGAVMVEWKRKNLDSSGFKKDREYWWL